jgi:hypothetical protein
MLGIPPDVGRANRAVKEIAHGLGKKQPRRIPASGPAVEWPDSTIQLERVN